MRRVSVRGPAVGAAVSQDQPAQKRKHRWLAWVGLEEPPADPEAWVPVATGRVDDADTGASNYASAIAQALADAGIEAQQRPYVVPDNSGLAAAVLLVNQSAGERVRVAVLVHNRDLARARPVVGNAHDPELGGSPVSEGLAALRLGAAVPSGTE
jgi:hypothetical protein